VSAAAAAWVAQGLLTTFGDELGWGATSATIARNEPRAHGDRR